MQILMIPTPSTKEHMAVTPENNASVMAAFDTTDADAAPTALKFDDGVR